MPDIEEIRRLLSLAEEFRQAVYSRVDDVSLRKAIVPHERECFMDATLAIDARRNLATMSWVDAWHVAYLAVFAAIVGALAVRRMWARLID